MPLLLPAQGGIESQDPLEETGGWLCNPDKSHF